MHKILRILKHLASNRWQVYRRLPRHSLSAIETAIHSSETEHQGELRFVVEAGLDWPDLFAGTSARQRALDVFSHLRIWDTEHNAGVLIYLLLADNRVEVLADRGINARVNQHEWIGICRDMETQFRMGNFETGALSGISAISKLLQLHFPATAKHPNELPDHPVIL